MNRTEVFAIIFKRNQGAILHAVDGLSHAEGLLQLPGDSNCMNWVAGHIVYTAMDCYSVIAKVPK